MASAERERVFFEFDRWGWDVKGWSPRTRLGYVYRARAADRYVREHYGRFLVWATEDMLTEYLFTMPSHPRNRNHIRQALVGFFEFAKWKKLVKVNPAIGLPKLKVPRAIPRALTADQAVAILNVLPIFPLRDQALVSTYLFTGMRRDEVRLLERRQLLEEPGWIRTLGKGSKERKVPVHAELARVLRRWLAESGNPQWVFPSPHQVDRPLSATTVQSTVRKIGNMAGIEGLHPHLFRHTWATQLLDEGANIRTVQVGLGHSSLSTTAGYLLVRPAGLEDRVTKLNYRASTTASSPDARSASPRSASL